MAMGHYLIQLILLVGLLKISNAFNATDLPRDCDDIVRLKGTKSSSGVYKIYPSSTSWAASGLEVYCDMKNGEGWTLIQRRAPPLEEPIDFERNMSQYERGFGKSSESFWLGLGAIADLTKFGDMRLRIDMVDWEDEDRYAEYDYFKVSPRSDWYRLHVDDFSGNAGDSFLYHSGMRFSTKDVDNDNSTSNCAEICNGAWWYKSCHSSNLNGLYLEGDHESYANGIHWNTWHGHHYSLKKVEMKVRSRHSAPECK